MSLLKLFYQIFNALDMCYTYENRKCLRQKYILDVLMHTITYEQLLGDVETHETQDRVLVYVVRLFLD